jgi:hypothetical protein
MRVAEHAYDKSYVRMFLSYQNANVSIAFSAGTGAGAGGAEEAAITLGVEPMGRPGHAVEVEVAVAVEVVVVLVLVRKFK